MDINKEIKNLKIYDSTMFRFNEVEKKYWEYLTLLITFPPEELLLFLEAIKQKEIINNQEIEETNPLLVEMDKLKHATNSIDYLAKIINNNEQFDLLNIKRLHRLVIRGTEDDKNENYNYRKRNIKVGKIVDGKEIISFIPPNYKEVIPLLSEVLKILNQKESLIFDNVFLKPLITHVLIAIIQPFGNGNTRVARLVQYGKILQMTNEKYKTQFSLPTFYLSENYMINGGYRRRIGMLANLMDNDNWNEWFKYNLNMIEEQIFYLSNEIAKIKKMK